MNLDSMAHLFRDQYVMLLDKDGGFLWDGEVKDAPQPMKQADVVYITAFHYRFEELQVQLDYS